MSDHDADAFYQPIVTNLGHAVAELTAERDRARDLAAKLEAQLAAVEALAAWGVGRDTNGVDRLVPASHIRAAINGTDA